MKWLRGIEDLSLGLILINFILFIVMGGIIFICKGSWVYLGFFILVISFLCYWLLLRLR